MKRITRKATEALIGQATFDHFESLLRKLAQTPVVALTRLGGGSRGKWEYSWNGTVVTLLNVINDHVCPVDASLQMFKGFIHYCNCRVVFVSSGGSEMVQPPFTHMRAVELYADYDESINGKPAPEDELKPQVDPAIELFLLEHGETLLAMMHELPDVQSLQVVEVTELLKGQYIRSKFAHIEPLAEIQSGCYVGAKAHIAAGTRLAANVIVGDNASIYGSSIIGRNTQIGESADIDMCRVAQNVIVGNDVTLEQSSVSENCVIEESVNVLMSKLYSGVRVTQGCSVTRSTIDSLSEIHRDVIDSYVEGGVKLYMPVYKTNIHAGADVPAGCWYMSVGPIGSRNDFFTVVEDVKRELHFYVGCANKSRTLQEFVEAVAGDYQTNDQHYIEYMSILGCIERTRRAFHATKGVKLDKLDVPKVNIPKIKIK